MSQELSKITCPSCNHAFSPTHAMAEELKKAFEEQFKQKALLMKKELEAKEAALQKEKSLLAQEKGSVNETVQKLLLKEKSVLEAKIKSGLELKTQLEMKDLQAQLLERSKQVDELGKAQLALRARARELEEKEKQQALELQKQLDAQKLIMEEDLRKRLGDEYKMKAAEKDLKLESMHKQIEELKRKAEQGSQQVQGEIMELEVERVLGAQFPRDTITPVAKGQRGGDTLQEVLAGNGQRAGGILYEVKNTKAWSDNWIQKAKDDQREAKADFVVIITSVLPKGVKNFDQIDGVWVSDMNCFLGLASALRHHINELYFSRSANIGRGEKLDALYHYMTDKQFKHHIEAIVEAFRGMQEGLAAEKRAMQKIWAAREKCIDRVVTSTVGLYGDVQGIIGTTLPKIASLELESGENSSLLPNQPNLQ